MRSLIAQALRASQSPIASPASVILRSKIALALRASQSPIASQALAVMRSIVALALRASQSPIASQALASGRSMIMQLLLSFIPGGFQSRADGKIILGLGMKANTLSFGDISAPELQIADLNGQIPRMV